MKKLFIIISIVMGIHLGAEAQIVNWDGSSMFGFSEITNYGSYSKRAIIYCTKPRTVTFKAMTMGFNGSSNVVGYYKVGSSFTETTGDWLLYATTNGNTYKTIELKEGRNYVEVGLRVYFPYSSPSMILFIDSYTPYAQPGEGEPGSTSGMNTALTVGI